jgi:DUF1680 family protein
VRFYQASVFDPLARGQDNLAGRHADTTIPKIIACLRMWEETGHDRYHDIAVNFWQIVTGHHCYVIGGTSNWEHWHAPDAVATQLSNRTCENCCSYNMLKLTRLLHFHQPHRVDLLDYYERVLFNQMLGEQDPQSAMVSTSTTPACRPPPSNASRPSWGRTPTSTPPTTAISPVTTAPEWKPRPSSPTPSIRVIRTAFSSTCSSRPR